jgi:hypothetical protein
MSNAKVLINTQAGTIELEGEDSFVRTYLDKLIPIIERARFGTGVGANSEAASAEAGSVPKARTRRRVMPTAIGESCRDRVKKLRDDGFFAERRGISDIVHGLEARGHAHNINQVGAALTTMFERREIQRTPVEGKFKYHWDHGTQSAAA